MIRTSNDNNSTAEMAMKKTISKCSVINNNNNNIEKFSTYCQIAPVCAFTSNISIAIHRAEKN